MIKHIMAAAVMWFASAVSLSSYAQQQDDHTLGSLWPAIEANYSGVNAKEAAVDAAKLNERAVKSGMLPRVQAQAQNTYGTYKGSAGAFFPQPGLFNVNGSSDALPGSSTAANSYSSATIEWELFTFGKQRTENEAAGALFHKSVSEKDAYLLKLKKLLSERYITLLYNNAKLNWTEKNVQRLNDIRKITTGLSAAGLRPAADSLLASSSFIQSLGEKDKWEGLREAAFIKLTELYEGDSIYYGASAERFIHPAERYLNGESNIPPSHPLLTALDNQSRYYTLSGAAQKKAALPSLRLLGGYAHRGTGINPNGKVSGAWKDGFDNTTDNMLVGIGVVWNITSLHTNRLKGESLLRQAEETKLLHRQYEQAMQADLAASSAKINERYKQLQKTSLAVKQVEDAYNMYLARYKSGIIGLSELLQIRMLLEQAENNHIEAAREYWMLLAYRAALTADFDFLFNHL